MICTQFCTHLCILHYYVFLHIHLLSMNYSCIFTFCLWTILAYSPFGYELFLHIHLLAMNYSCIFTFCLWTILAYSPFGYELFLHIHLLAMNYSCIFTFWLWTICHNSFIITAMWICLTCNIIEINSWGRKIDKRN